MEIAETAGIPKINEIDDIADNADFAVIDDSAKFATIPEIAEFAEIAENDKIADIVKSAETPAISLLPRV